MLQQAATLSPPEPWLPDLLVDSDGQDCQCALPLGGGVMPEADSVCLQTRALIPTAVTPADSSEDAGQSLSP